MMWLKRDKIIEIERFGGGKDFVTKRKYLIVYSFFFILSQCKDRREGVQCSLTSHVEGTNKIVL